MLAYDSDNLDDVPSDAPIVLYYNDGEPGTATPSQLARFPTPFKLSITRRLGVSAYWADIENGTMGIADGVEAWRTKLVKGLYISESPWSDLRAAIASAGLSPPPYWVAAYPTVTPTDPQVPQSWIDLGCVMWQYVNEPRSGGHWDLSVTAPGFPIPIPSPPSPVSLLLIGSKP